MVMIGRVVIKEESVQYYSESKNEWVDVDNMDEQHCRNALKKIIRKYGVVKDEQYKKRN